MDTQALEARSELVDLNDLVRTTEQSLTALAGDRIAVATALEPCFSPITADPRELKQALLNLVLNARDAMPDGGKITIETANVVLDETYAADHRLMPQGHYALLAVTDTGTGMDAEPRAHLFEPYFTTRDRSSRSGLGLATVYGVVKRSGGFVWVYSEPGLGTSVKIYLPLPLMSGYPAAAIGRHQMLERGLAFLQKPFSAGALAQKVREVLGYRRRRVAAPRGVGAGPQSRA